MGGDLTDTLLTIELYFSVDNTKRHEFAHLAAILNFHMIMHFVHIDRLHEFAQ